MLETTCQVDSKAVKGASSTKIIEECHKSIAFRGSAFPSTLPCVTRKRLRSTSVVLVLKIGLIFQSNNFIGALSLTVYLDPKLVGNVSYKWSIS